MNAQGFSKDPVQAAAALGLIERLLKNPDLSPAQRQSLGGMGAALGWVLGTGGRAVDMLLAGVPPQGAAPAPGTNILLG